MYDNIHRTKYTNIQTSIHMLSLTHTHNKITQDVRQYIQDKTHNQTNFHEDALTDTHT